MDFGAFVELEPGVEGLIHVSEMSWSKKNVRAVDILKPGENVEVVVLNVNPTDKRIALGLKQALGDPWEDALKILAPISLKIDPYYPGKQEETIDVYVVSPKDDYGQYLTQYYEVKENIVTAIDIDSNYDFATSLYFRRFIHENGLPTEFYINSAWE